MNWARHLTWIAVCAVVLGTVSMAACGSTLQKDEEKLGKEYAADIEKQITFITEPAQLERVQRIGDELAAIANKIEVPARYGSSEVCRFDYRFKLVDDKNVNAFSLPGGRVYVNSGLLEMIESDDELAGVLAHEIAHAAHHHMTQLLKKQSSVDKYVALIALAGILGNVRGSDLNNLLMGAQMIKVGKLSGYTMEAERDADRTAVAYLAKSKYRPEEMLTFMRKLEKKHADEPSVPLGIFQDHPAPFRRVKSILQAIKAEGIDVDLRKLEDLACAKATPIAEGSEQYQVVINDRVIFQPAGLGAGPTSKERADSIAKAVNEALDSRILPKDLTKDSTGTCLMVRHKPVLKIEAEDARDRETAQTLLEKARSAMEYAVWADWLSHNCALAQMENEEE